MTSFKLKFAAVAVLSALSAPTLAGWEELPITGFTAVADVPNGQPTGGTTAYKTCNSKGNFGSQVTFDRNFGNCKSPIATTAINTAPDTGYTLLRAASRTITMNNALTNNTNVALGTVQDRVFRNATSNQCIFATQASLTGGPGTDHFPAASMPGNLTFEVNGIARGGFSAFTAPGSLHVSYSRLGDIGEALFRAGRTFTSVQHRAAGSVDNATPAAGYYNLPLLPTPLGILPSVVGEASTALSVPNNPTFLNQQNANRDANWVEFTTDANSSDPDGGAKTQTAAVYVRVPCTAAQIPTATAVNDAIRLRMSWQEQGALVQAFVEVRVPGFVPVGGNALPAVVPGSTF